MAAVPRTQVLPCATTLPRPVYESRIVLLGIKGGVRSVSQLSPVCGIARHVGAALIAWTATTRVRIIQRLRPKNVAPNFIFQISRRFWQRRIWRRDGRKIGSMFQMSAGGTNSRQVNFADLISISFVYNAHTENRENILRYDCMSVRTSTRVRHYLHGNSHISTFNISLEFFLAVVPQRQQYSHFC